MSPGTDLGSPAPTSPMSPAGRDPLEDVSGATLLRNALLFARALRGAGLRTDLTGAMDFARALTLVEVGDREQVRAAGAAIFVRRRDEVPAYDETFRLFWRHHELRIAPEGDAASAPRPSDPGDPATIPETRPETAGRERLARRGQGDAATDETERDRGDGAVTTPRAYSAREALRHREFERMTPAELREAERAIDALRPRLETRRTRRRELDAHGRVVAPRAMLRKNLRTGGDPVDWVWRRPVRRPRPVVVICDVSGSMERHGRLLLRFAHALSRANGVRAEAFVFGTRLTRVTRELRARDPDRALARVAATVADWSGGTRIGDSFRDFNLRWARRTLRSSGVVVVVSDGWDRGDPELVRSETARLQRSCHRLIWLNPLAGHAEYRPLAAGMAAAYPSIDDFLPIHDLASLERLASVLAGLPGSRGGRPERRGRPRVHLANESPARARRPAGLGPGALDALRRGTPPPLDAPATPPGRARPLA